MNVVGINDIISIVAVSMISLVLGKISSSLLRAKLKFIFQRGFVVA